MSEEGAEKPKQLPLEGGFGQDAQRSSQPLGQASGVSRVDEELLKAISQDRKELEEAKGAKADALRESLRKLEVLAETRGIDLEKALKLEEGMARRPRPPKRRRGDWGAQMGDPDYIEDLKEKNE